MKKKPRRKKDDIDVSMLLQLKRLMKRKLQEFDRQWLRRTKNCTPTQRLEWLTDAQNFCSCS